MSNATVVLPGTDIAIAPLGVGTWAWGDRAVWGMGGYDARLTEASIREAWEASIDAGATFFDTAEVYGDGESERIIGALLAADPDRASQMAIATKFMPMPWKVNVRRSLLSSLRASLDRLGREAVDLYQIHGPISLRGQGALADALADAHAAGLVRAVGVSNYSARETRSMGRLRRRGRRPQDPPLAARLTRHGPGTGSLGERHRARGRCQVLVGVSRRPWRSP